MASVEEQPWKTFPSLSQKFTFVLDLKLSSMWYFFSSVDKGTNANCKKVRPKLANAIDAKWKNKNNWSQS